MTAELSRRGFRLAPAGDAALVVTLEPEGIDPAVNARAIALAAALAARAIPGVRDIVPAYCSVAVHFHPLATDVVQLTRAIDAAAAAADATAAPPEAAPLREVPVCYDESFGPDLADVARFARLAAADVIRRHAGREYRVYMLGFLPGFAYMGTVDGVIAAPRRSTPRPVVPAGSVGIAGLQTGVYPVSSPGGWQIIGRTPVRPFDPMRTEPFLFGPGDRVRFVPIDRGEFNRLEQWT